MVELKVENGLQMKSVMYSPAANRTSNLFALIYTRRPRRLNKNSQSVLWAWGRRDNYCAATLVSEKASICTADELHHVNVPNTDWTLALWHYNPPSQASPRNHLVLLLFGIATNAIGYDLAPRLCLGLWICQIYYLWSAVLGICIIEGVLLLFIFVEILKVRF